MILSALLLMMAAMMATAQPRDPSYKLPAAPPTILKKVGIDQKLDAQVPLELPFRDEAGRSIRLGDYFKGKPVILVLAYYECPMLCTEVLNGVAKTLRPISFDMGKEYEVVTVSINPKETPKLAAEKKANYVKRYGRPGTEGGWHFLTGTAENIARVCSLFGVEYFLDEGLITHTLQTAVIDREGRLAATVEGKDYSGQQLGDLIEQLLPQ